MKNKHGMGIRLIEMLVTLPIILFVCVVSVPSIIRIGFEHLKYKIKK
jgi:competence protein ComGC